MKHNHFDLQIKQSKRIFKISQSGKILTNNFCKDLNSWCSIWMFENILKESFAILYERETIRSAPNVLLNVCRNLD